MGPMGPMGPMGAPWAPMGPMFPNLKKLFSKKVSKKSKIQKNPKMSVLGMKTKVVRSEILYDSVQEINSGASYNAVSRTFEILPNPWIPRC